MATMPGTPDPGSTGLSFSSNTLQRSPSMNLAVGVSMPLAVTDAPMPRASEEEKASINMAPGICSSMPCFTSRLHITPDEVTAAMLEASYLPLEASRAFSSGLPKASPTITSEVGLCLSMTRRASSASKVSPSSRITQPPANMAPMEVRSPVPCISGGAVSSRPPGPTVLV